MKKYDYRFNNELLKSFVGKTFNKYIHQEFVYTKTATLYVGFMIDNISYQIENDYEAIDYFGWDEEATTTKLYAKDWGSIVDAIGENASIASVDETIKSIKVINDHYSSFSHNEQDYDFWETRAIIFGLGEHEISFVKSDCWFSMEIEINKGNNLIDKLPDGKFILDDFNQSDKQHIEVEREIISF